VASALDAAHAAGLLHRDVKPANMLVNTVPGRPDHVYLSDLGLSKAAMSSTGLTRKGEFLGTPEYVSPEQIAGQPADGRADEYALACSAFELLTGAPPFRRDEAVAVMYACTSPARPGPRGHGEACASPRSLLLLGAGDPQVSAPRRVSATEFQLTFSFTFTIGTNAYHWRWNTCLPDTEAADGMGLARPPRLREPLRPRRDLLYRLAAARVGGRASGPCAQTRAAAAAGASVPRR
jgi:serine/threonine protein kinase